MLGDRKKAAELKDRYLELKDSIYNQRQFDMAKNQQFLYEMEKTEREIIKLNERQARDAMLISRQRMVLWGVVGAVILAVLLLYYFYRQKKKLADNYRNLYDIHQRMLSDHRDYTDRYMAVSRENEALHERILQLSGQTDSGGGEGVTELPADMPPLAESDTDADCADSKYKRSGLSSSQRDRLARAVTEVMENVRPFCSTDFSLNNLAAEVDQHLCQRVPDKSGLRATGGHGRLRTLFHQRNRRQRGVQIIRNVLRRVQKNDRHDTLCISETDP